MRIALRAKEKLAFIEGPSGKPADKESKEFKQWRKADFMVQSWLLSSIAKEMTDSFLYVSYAKKNYGTFLKRDMVKEMVCSYLT